MRTRPDGRTPCTTTSANRSRGTPAATRCSGPSRSELIVSSPTWACVCQQPGQHQQTRGHQRYPHRLLQFPLEQHQETAARGNGGSAFPLQLARGAGKRRSAGRWRRDPPHPARPSARWRRARPGGASEPQSCPGGRCPRAAAESGSPASGCPGSGRRRLPNPRGLGSASAGATEGNTGSTGMGIALMLWVPIISNIVPERP